MKSYIILGIGIVTFLGGIFLFWLSRQNSISSQGESYQLQVQTSTQPTSTPTKNAATFMSPTSTSKPVVTISPNQTSTSWLDAQTLIQRCQVASVDEMMDIGGSFLFWLAGSYVHITLKNKQMLALIDPPPSASALDVAIQNVSSTCGVIPVTRRIFTYDIP